MKSKLFWIGLLALTLTGCRDAELCSGGADEDGDGQVDCDDADCAADAACLINGSCGVPIALSDPSSGVAGDTTGQPNSMDGSCQAGGGPDVVFSLTPTSGLLEIVLSPAAADLGVFVIPAASCLGDGSVADDELECEDFGFAGDPEELELSVTPGQEIFIVVGGFSDDDSGAFTLDLASRDIVCGDGAVDGDEECDDANTAGGDGCDAACQVELGFECSGEPSLCAPLCGNGFRDAFDGEECDDANAAAGDGCDACLIEPGFSCDGNPSVCADITAECAAAVAAQASTAGDTAAGSDDFAPLGCFGGAGKENVFTFVPQAAELTITVTPADPAGFFDAVVYAFSGDCVDTDEIDCEDSGFSGDIETLSLQGLAVGQEITIVVDSFSDGDEGAYTLTIE